LKVSIKWVNNGNRYVHTYAHLHHNIVSLSHLPTKRINILIISCSSHSVRDTIKSIRIYDNEVKNAEYFAAVHRNSADLQSRSVEMPLTASVVAANKKSNKRKHPTKRRAASSSSSSNRNKKT